MQSPLGDLQIAALFDGSPDLVFVMAVGVDGVSRFVWANEVFRRTTGLTGEALLGRRADELLPPDQAASALARHAQVIQQRETLRYEETFSVPAGEITTEGTLIPIFDGDQPTHLVGMLRDVTQRARAEAAAHEAETRLLAVISSAAITVSATTSEGIITLSEGKGLADLGQQPGQTVGRSIFEMYASRPEILDLYRRAYAGEPVVGSAEVAGRVMEGTILPLRDPAGEVTGAITVGFDATDRVVAERALAASEAQARALMDYSPDAIFVGDATGVLIDLNPAGCALLGGEREQFLGQTLADIVPTEDLEKEPPAFDRLPVGRALRISRRFRRLDGALTNVELHVSRLPDGRIQAVGRDVTERVKMEIALRESQAYLARAQELAGLGTWEFDIEAGVMTVSPNVKAMTGVPVETDPLFPAFVSLVHPDDLDRVTANLEQAGETDDPIEVGFRIRHSVDGAERHLRFRAQRDRPGHLIGTGIDETERVRSERMLREQEAALLQAQRIAKLGGWEWNIATRRAIVSDSGYELYGYRAGDERPTGNELLGNILPEDRDRLRDALIAAGRDGRALSVEFRIRHLDGGIRHFEIQAEPQLDAAGVASGLIGTTQDVTERALATEQLRIREAELARAQEIAHLGSWEWDPVTGTERWSDECYRIFGHEPGSLSSTNETFRSFVHPDDLARVVSTDQIALDLGGRYEITHRIVRPDGEVRVVHQQLEVERDGAGHPGRVVGTIQDVTERAAAQEQLRLRQAELARAQAVAHVGSWELDVGSAALHWSDETFRIFGYEPDSFEPTLEAYARLLDPEDRERMRARNARALEGGTEDLLVEPYQRITRLDGTVRMIATETQVEFAADGRPIRITGTIQDVTERAAADLERSRLAAAVEQAGELVMVTEPSGIVTYVNAAFEEITGFPRGDVLGRPPQVLRRGDHLNPEIGAMWQELQAGRQWSGQMTPRRRDGSLYDLELLASPVRDDDGRIVSFVSVGRDVTRERLLEEQLRQSQKMEAVGRLAGGIAHDFNNLLTAILGYGDLLLAELSVDDPRREDAVQIRRAGERAADLTRQLLAFSRRTVLQPRTISLNDVVVEVSRLLDRLIGEDVHLLTTLEPRLEPINADPSQLEQVLINLAVNARDAMPSGGTLSIETRNVTIDEALAATQIGIAVGRYVELAVSDTGIGMSPEIQARVFEPFFTTKDPGKGTGLGLATVFGIVEMSDGHVTLHSTPGEGTTFRILLPVSESELTTSLRPDAPAASGVGTERILVVEDDPAVRSLIEATLSAGGYETVVAGEGQAALEIVGSGVAPFDLVITDVVMPGMTGVELVRRLRAAHPSVAVLYSSGYAADALADREALGPDFELLAKPFGPGELLSRVRAVLDRWKAERPSD
jgi:PAS domain S-box-containing protein